MDSSRDADLRRLRAELNNPRTSLARKVVVHRIAKKIVGQMKDRKLTAMRHRLVKAARAHDMEVEWKMTNLIRDYLKEEKMDA